MGVTYVSQPPQRKKYVIIIVSESGKVASKKVLPKKEGQSGMRQHTGIYRRRTIEISLSIE